MPRKQVGVYTRDRHIPTDVLEHSKKQIKKYIEKHKTGFYTQDIIDDLNIDPLIVIKVLNQLATENMIKQTEPI
jgi:uncharacterized FAD-dependent dehydrogenase